MKALDRGKTRGLDFKVWANADGTYPTEQVTIVLLQDIRDELAKLNQLLGCPNFIAIPAILRELRDASRMVAVNTKRRKRKRKPVLRSVA